jgi:tRNA-2-methylthio-N6-dimethylallyladenosine synthase
MIGFFLITEQPESCFFNFDERLAKIRRFLCDIISTNCPFGETMRILFTEDINEQKAIESVHEWTKARGGQRYYLRTFGCQMNDHDAQLLRGILHAMGYEQAQEPEEADLILFNTCAVRENAHQRVFGNIGRLKALKEKSRDVIIGLCGCMAELPKVQQTLRQTFPYVSLAFGPYHLYRLPSLLLKLINKEVDRVFMRDTGEYSVVEGIDKDRIEGMRALVSIMEGCDNFCSYCIVPYTRGRERSRRSVDILKEIHELVDQGYREVMLLGQNVNSYGKGLDEDIDFASLLERVSAIEGLWRIRFMTSHPKDLSDRLIDVMARCKNVMPSLHLPVQSGSDRILKKMNRKYSRDQYLALVRRLRRSIPDISLTTDIIMGFPGEEEQDVIDTIDLIREVGYDSAFTFLYSPREGTPAASWENTIPQDIRQMRFERMLDVLNEGVIAKNAAKVAKVYEVLVDTCESEGKWSGRTPYNDLIRFESTDDLYGKLVHVRVTRARKFSLEGVVIE